MRKLFLDNTQTPDVIAQHISNQEVKKYYNTGDWDIVRSYNEFIEYIEKRGLPDFISFGYCYANNSSATLTEEELLNTPYQKKEKNGVQCANWLIEYCVNKKKNLPKFFVHSTDLIEKKRIEQILSSFNKLQTFLQ
jgi:hypothetical protein